MILRWFDGLILNIIKHHRIVESKHYRIIESTTQANKSLKMKSLVIFLSIVFQFSFLNAQIENPKNWTLRGYVKNMNTFFFIDDKFSIDPAFPAIPIDALFQENLVHNRLNFNWFLNEKLTFKTELRNRMISGDFTRLLGDSYSEVLDEANDYMDLSLETITSKGIAFQSMLDRLYLEFASGKWEIRLGRQRVNWGINTIWNPNDIFNAFSFTDFDYEERPGSDALRIRYFTGFASSIEIAAKAFDDFDEATIAGLWKFNQWNYDFQILGGIAQRDLVFGGGWAGSLKNAGFKGEFSYFYSLEDNIDDSFGATFAIDYMFSNSLYFSGGFLYNSSGRNASGSEILNFELSARDLYPYKFNFMAQALYPFHPLLNGVLVVLYSPGKANALFLTPTLTYSIADNWDLDLVGQVVFSDDGKYRSPLQAFFVRTKFSF